MPCQQYFLSLVVVLIAATSTAQETKEGKTFSPAKEVLVIGDIDHAPPGKLPPGWKLHAGRTSSKGVAEVKKINGEMAIVSVSSSCAGIEPVWDTLKKLGNSFSFEFYYFQDSSNNKMRQFIRIYFDNPSVQSRDALVFTIDRSGKMDLFSSFNSFAGSSSERETTNARYPAQYDPSKWHHAAVSYTNGTVDWYLDSYHILTALSNVKPERFWIDGEGVFGIRQLNLARNAHASSFDRIIKENKMQTHAIGFDIGSAAISPQSMGYIHDLADWLKKNPVIKLKIAGHTDSTGKANANLKLSANRAVAIKNELLNLGIDEKRLTTSGYGSNKPIATNSTESGRAQNRRVEFERL